jgi:type IV secretion system protein VirB11
LSTAAAEVIPTGIYLRSSLVPFASVLERPDVTDIYVNRPGEYWIEVLGGVIEQHLDSAINEIMLGRLARQIAALTHQGVSREHPLLAATLPDGSRIQVVAPPATRGPLALAIRRQIAGSLTLQDYAAGDHFAGTESQLPRRSDELLRQFISKRDFAGALALAVKARKNIIVSGGTSSGKTTFLNALLREIPSEERLILIEDTPELVPHHQNCVGLVSVRGQLGEAEVTTDDLLTAALRMRPDRIIVGELRGAEAFTFLRAVNTGHPGSMTTIHADSPLSAVEQLVMLGLIAGTSLGRDDLRHHIRQSIDLFVHLSRNAGRRSVDTVILANDLAAGTT